MALDTPPSAGPSLASPPVAEKRPSSTTHHGICLSDDYAWLRDPGYPEVTDPAIKIPHMGWNTVKIAKENPLIPLDSVEEQRFYFVHSYHAVCTDPQDVLATTFHGCEITAALSKGNVMGVQFHPEKSHRFGMALMRRFVELKC